MYLGFTEHRKLLHFHFHIPVFPAGFPYPLEHRQVLDCSSLVFVYLESLHHYRRGELCRNRLVLLRPFQTGCQFYHHQGLYCLFLWNNITTDIKKQKIELCHPAGLVVNLLANRITTTLPKNVNGRRTLTLFSVFYCSNLHFLLSATSLISPFNVGLYFNH